MAVLIYTFDHIAPNATHTLFIHGYGYKQAVLYSSVSYPISGQQFPGGRAALTQGETSVHVDGTVAHTVYVQNLDQVTPCKVDIFRRSETAFQP